MITREHLIREMGYQHARGMLVPFLGSGMSRPICSSWPGMVSKLEQAAASGSGSGPRGVIAGDDLGLTRRAARALEQLRRAERGDPTATALRHALLEAEPGRPPDAAVALAKLECALILTTNYDDLYLAAAHEQFLRTRIGTRPWTDRWERTRPPLELLGRSPSDCHRVLSALHGPARPILWTLQGFLGGQALIATAPEGDLEPYEIWTRPGSGEPHTDSRTEELEGQLVVGHAEYRAVAMRSESFRRAFAEVYRSRSMLFLGSGLRDRYLLDLFSQVSELYGASSQPHYAVVAADDEVDGEFLGRYFGIRLVEVDRYTEISSLLSEIQAAADDSTARRHWSYQLPGPSSQTPSSVEIREEDLHAASPLGCIIISGGGSQAWPRLNLGMIDYLIAVGVLPEDLLDLDERPRRKVVGKMLRKAEGRTYTWVFDDPPGSRNPARLQVLVARARLDARSSLGRQVRPVVVEPSATRADRAGRLWRDLRLIKPVMIEALEVAAEAGHQEVQSTILSSGDLRSFPASFALQEMVRAWTHSALDGHYLRIHVVDPSVLRDLRSGRLDLAHPISIASSATQGSALQFWLEVVERGGRSTRLLELRHATSAVKDLLEEHSLLNRRWAFSLWPEPCLEWMPWTVADIARWEAEHNGSVMTLETFGVVRGSTLRITEGSAYDKLAEG